MRYLISLLLCSITLMMAVPVNAQENPYDNLTVLGIASTLTDETGATLTLGAFHTKYKEAIVGMYFKKNNQSVRFYMNLVTWDKFKQDLIRARDQWPTLKPTEFERAGTVKGYQIANKLATLRISLVGETQLSARRLLISAQGGADVPHRASVALKEQGLKDLVDDFYKVDDFLHSGKLPPAK